jgi:hypothetical protein
VSYKTIKRLSDAIAGMEGFGKHWKIGRQVWVKARTTRSKQATLCANCRKPVGTQAYRPMPSPATGSRNRYERLCVACVEGKE